MAQPARWLVPSAAALTAALALAAAADRPVERSFDFTYQAELRNIPPGARKVAVWIPYPTSDSHQEISHIQVRCPYPTRVTTEPKYQNHSLYVEVDDPKESSFTVEISFDVTRKEYVRHDFA